MGFELSPHFFLAGSGIFFNLVTFYFLGHLVAGPTAGYLAAYGHGGYFPFVLMGLALASFQGVALTSISSAIQYGMYTGTLEAMLVTPTSLSTIIFASVLYQFVSALFSLLLYVAFGVLLFGVSLGKANLLSAVVMLGLALLAQLPIGIISAGFLLVFKRGNPLTPLVGSLSSLLGGVYFPLAVLPGWLQSVVLLPALHPRPGRVAPSCPERPHPAGVEHPGGGPGYLRPGAAPRQPGRVLLYRPPGQASRHPVAILTGAGQGPVILPHGNLVFKRVYFSSGYQTLVSAKGHAEGAEESRFQRWRFFTSCRMTKPVWQRLLDKHGRRGVILAGDDVTDDVGLFLEALEAQEHVGFVLGGHRQHQADAVVEGAEHFLGGDLALFLDNAEDGGHRPAALIDHRLAGARQDAGQIAGETAAGDVADAADREVPEEVQHGVDVNAGGPEELLPQGLA